MLAQLNFLISTGFYSGLSSVAPGTCGSLAFTIVWIATNQITPLSTSTWTAITCVFIALGILSTTHAMKNHSFFNGGDKDPSAVVIDEWCGQSVALFGTGIDQPLYILAAFILFRLFDITKPLPVSRAERLPGAAGIMADDLVAGALALCCLELIKVMI